VPLLNKKAIYYFQARILTETTRLYNYLPLNSGVWFLGFPLSTIPYNSRSENQKVITIYLHYNYYYTRSRRVRMDNTKPIAKGQWVKIPFGFSHHAFKRGKVLRTSKHFAWVQEVSEGLVFRVRKTRCLCVNGKVCKLLKTITKTRYSRRHHWRSN
jgi:hypothetical protein